MHTLLVIDDDPHVLKALTLALAGDETQVIPASSAEAGVDAFTAARPEVVLCDVRLPGTSGLDLLARLKSIDHTVPVVLMTGHGTAETAIEAMRRGAFDYVLKPIDPIALQEMLDKAFALGRLLRVPTVLPTADQSVTVEGDQFIGRCPAMQEVFKQIGRVAPTDATVLILGESGTGKELVARAVYQHSRREGKPFLALNCAAIPEQLLESELFGHEKGAFTGADRKRIGKFEQCDGGTLFLDEIGDMTLLTQAKVLRVLQEKQFERVGGSEAVRANVRLIAATHRDLPGMNAVGTFREDLYYRLNVCPIHLPPLRDRGDDLPLLVEHFVRQSAGEFGKEVTAVADEAMAALRAYPWPGNVRQLQSVLKQGLLRTVGPLLTADSLPCEVRTPGCPAAESAAAGSDTLSFIRRRLKEGTADLYAELLERVERELLTEVLTHTRGNITRAAQLLGITRPTLRSKLAHQGLAVETKSTVAEFTS